jgi:branched-chain amino acid aminotransferase
MDITIDTVSPELRGKAPTENLGFGGVFTDHMFTQNYDAGQGWHSATIAAVHDLSLHPAAAVLHYGQEIFEGLKAYRRSDGGINLFRPDQNTARFNSSAARMVMPQVPVEDHLDAISQLVSIERDWVPSEHGSSLYLRPAMIATSAKLGLDASASYLHFILASPSGPYFKEGFNPVSVLVSDTCRRAVRGGIGEAKTGGNYAASLYMSDLAKAEGFTQVLWLDAVEGRFIEEVGAMNICFVVDGKKIVTPELSGSILAGITRDSVLQLAPTLGFEVEEARLDIGDIVAGISSGEITEVFGCGTAAVISPVGKLRYRDQDVEINGMQAGPVASRLFDELTGIQYGLRDDPFGWVVPVPE